MTRDRSWRRYMPAGDWPSADKFAWTQALTEGDILDGGGPASHWAEATRRTNEHHYGRWLGFLDHDGLLVSHTPPQGRVTPANVRPYIDHLKAEVAPRTVVSTLVGLKVVMKAIAPDNNWRWLEDVCNALNRSSEPQNEKRVRLRPTGEIHGAAIAELERLSKTPLKRRIERVAFRDTLMVALMASTPLRLKNFAGIHIGRHLVQEHAAWAVKICGADVKNKAPLDFLLPESVIPFLTLYMERVRPSFLKYGTSNALWLTFEGAPLAAHSIYTRFPLVTKRLVGVAINPHLFRDCLATSMATASPELVFAAAAMLGHRNFATTERYYIHANRLDASRKLNGALHGVRQTLSDRSTS